MSEYVFDEFIKKFWNYYLAIESEFAETQKYVDFDSKNNATFSMEYLKLLQAICSEIDGAAKEFAVYANPDFKVKSDTNIQKWGLEIQTLFPDIQEKTVSFNKVESITPWKRWKYERYKDKKGGQRICLVKEPKAETPKFWIYYNKVKHNRMNLEKQDSNFVYANMKNVKDALAALYVLERCFADYLYSRGEIKRLDFKKSNLFDESAFKEIV